MSTGQVRPSGPRSLFEDPHLVEAGLCVQLAEGGDDEGLGRALGLEVWPVGRHGLGVGQGTDLGEEVRKLAAILKTSRIHGNNGNNLKAKLVAIITP